MTVFIRWRFGMKNGMQFLKISSTFIYYHFLRFPQVTKSPRLKRLRRNVFIDTSRHCSGGLDLSGLEIK